MAHSADHLNAEIYSGGDSYSSIRRSAPSTHLLGSQSSHVAVPTQWQFGIKQAYNELTNPVHNPVETNETFLPLPGRFQKKSIYKLTMPGLGDGLE